MVGHGVWFLLLAGVALASPTERSGDYHICGKSSYSDAGGARAAPYIIGGQKARKHEFPWVVSLRWAGQTHLYAHTCMGILLREDWVVTAAHCVVATPLHEYVAVVGSNNIFDTNVTNPYRQEIEIEDWFWHERHAMDIYYESDIAMVKLKKKVVLNQNVRTICYGHPTYDYTGEEGVIAGWGEQNWGNGDYSEDLKYFTARIMSNPECQERMNGITENMLCAGDAYERENAPCGGDNAAPLVVYRGMWEFVGMYSWSSGCANGSPTVYLRVNKYHDWMDSIMKNYPNIPNYP